MLEWIDPLYCAGHWVPDLVTAAGAEPVLGVSGQRSRRITTEELRASAPEVIVVAPCGYELDDASAQAATLVDAGALPDGVAVWAVDANAAFVRPGPRVVDGVEALAAIAHPDRFDLPEELARVGVRLDRELRPTRFERLVTARSHTVPSKNAGFMPACRRAGLRNISSRNSRSPITPVLDELERLLDRLGHVGDVPVRDVAAEDRTQPRAARVAPLGERPRDQSVVGLAAEVEVRHEAVAKVLDRVDQSAAANSSSCSGRALGSREVRAQLVRVRPGRARRRSGRRAPMSASTSSRSGSSVPIVAPVALLPVTDESENRLQAHATPPSRNPKRNVGKRCVTPDRNSDLHSDSWFAAKPPMWL